MTQFTASLSGANNVGFQFDLPASASPSSYDIAYLTDGTCPDATTFAAANHLANLPAPSGNTTERFTAVIADSADATPLCFAVRYTDASNQTSDVSAPAFPPARVVGLAASGITTDSLTFGWTAVGTDFNAGAGQSTYALSYLALASGGVCPTDALALLATNGVQTMSFGAAADVGTAESDTLGALTFNTSYCVTLSALDPDGNSSFSDVAVATTATASDPAPGTIVFGSISAGDIGASSATLSWTAPADNAGDASSGPVASYSFVFIGPVLPTDCYALGQGDFARATPFAAQPTPAAPGTTQTFTFTRDASLPHGTYCIGGIASDATSSSYSAWLEVRDNTPPGAIADLAVARDTQDGATFTFTAPGNDGSADTTTAADSYVVEQLAGACPDLATFESQATVVDPGVAPSVPGTAESFTLTGFDRTARYCLAVVANDVGDVGSISNLVELEPVAADSLTALRTSFASQGGSPFTFSPTLELYGAVVTYVKPAFGGAATGTADGRGFFVQSPAGGAAMFFAIDPTGALGGSDIAVGDLLDIQVSAGAWLCSGTCTASNSIFAVTSATFSSLGFSELPAAIDLTGTDLTTSDANALGEDGQLVTYSATLGSTGWTANGAGFALGYLSSGNSSAPLRVGDTVLEVSGLSLGCAASVTATPLWRSDATPELAAWNASDLSYDTSCAAVTTSPSDGATGVDQTTAIGLTFNAPVQPATLTAQALTGTCAGTVQLSASSSFTSCLGFASTSDGGTASFADGGSVNLTGALVTGFDTAATLTPAQPLAANTTYFLKVSGVALGDGTALPSSTMSTGFTTGSVSTVCASTAQVVISQYYGAGGLTNALYQNDYVELHNRTNSTISLSGWTLYYSSASGNAWTSKVSLTGSIGPGGYYLIKLSSGGGVGSALPTPDATGAIDMSSSSGKLALVHGTYAIGGSTCPTNVVDLVSVGSSATSCNGSPTPSASATLAVFRKGDTSGSSCVDTNTDLSDFATGSPSPRNSASTATGPCLCRGNPLKTENETNFTAEADYCAIVQATPDITVSANGTSDTLYAQIYEGGVTPSSSGIVAQVGWGPSALDPSSTAGWLWQSATYDGAGPNDPNNAQYKAQLAAPTATGVYGYAFRFSLDNGVSWTYCDKDGAGSNANLDFSTAQLPTMTVQ